MHQEENPNPPLLPIINAARFLHIKIVERFLHGSQPLLLMQLLLILVVSITYYQDTLVKQSVITLPIYIPIVIPVILPP